MSRLTLRAYAKLNLTLEVLGRRPDGYHEVASVLQTISLADTLTFQPAATLELECQEALHHQENLVLRAAHLLQEETGCTAGALITLEKGVPLASGLGGGSTDAATTLWALAQLWGLTLPEAHLSALAAKLGADVPFFLWGGTALAQGRGERINPLPPAPQTWFLVVRPKVELPQKTATLYGLLGSDQWTKGRATHQLAEALRRGGPIREAYLYNAFDGVASHVFPTLSYWRRRMLEAAPSRPHVTGTGPSLYIPVESEGHGQEVARRLEAEAPGAPPSPEADIFVVSTAPHGREQVEGRV